MTTPDKNEAAKTAEGKNLAIWSQVETTDAKATKKIEGSELTSISHNYQIKRATALFGPCGIGWGFRVIKAEILEGALLVPDKPALGVAKVSSIHIEFWYKHNGEKGVLEHFGQTPFVSKKTSGELSTEDDAHKKSLTDALSKSLSMLGFSADIYGEYNGANGASATETGNQPLVEDDDITKSIKACKTMEELAAIWGKLPKGDNAKYQKAKDDKKAELA